MAVMEIVETAGDISKDLIVEQLLALTNMPLINDDNDEMWEDMIDAYKMVIVINTELNMSKGKTASQASHATLGLYKNIVKRPDLSDDLTTWDETGGRKIVLEAKNSAELIQLRKTSILCKVPYFSVRDAGLTEIPSNSFTALAIFGTDDQLRPVTGKLRLLK